MGHEPDYFLENYHPQSQIIYNLRYPAKKSTFKCHQLTKIEKVP